MDPIVAAINTLIQQKLPGINQSIDGQIASRNLDPWVHVTSGGTRLGSIDLGICTAYVDADYEVDNLTGLAGVAIRSLQVTACGPNPKNPQQINGTLGVVAGLGGISAGVGGSVTAGCGFIHQRVGLSGTASAASVEAEGTGNFQAGLVNGQLCLNSVQLNQLSIGYNGLRVNIDGLGFFNDFLQPLENAILDQFNGQIRDLIAGALTPVLNSQIGSVLPLCTSLA